MCLSLHSQPLLVLSECALCYLPVAAADAVLAWAARSAARTLAVCYEPILPGDAFGRVMRQNLEVRTRRRERVCVCVCV
jgi:[phosphatase 2A protein]-leucine-carboxy methyltransferase